MNLSHNVIVANIISSSFALVGSYLLNSRLTFRSKKWTLGSFVAFIAVTVFGLWVLQTAAIYGLSDVLKHVPQTTWVHLGILQHLVKQALPKLLATGVTLVWNYLWYNKVIFKSTEHDEAMDLTMSNL